MPSTILTHLHHQLLTITMNRPEVHNAFNEVVIAELTQAFETAGNDPAVRVVVLAGAGKSFSAGADVNWMKKMVGYSYEENVDDARAMANMLRSIRACPRPVIARVHGAALGGGVGLTAACDVAVALRSASFGLTEVRLGILPAVISPYVMEKIGSGAMRRYALTAERFGGDIAMRLGLVQELADSEDGLDQAVKNLADGFMQNGPEAMAECKRVLREVQPIDWDAATDATTRAIAQRRVSSEGQDGLHAFLEKRPPRWSKS